MKELIIMRHAKSDWDNARLSDHERPLNKRGKQDAPAMGRLLRDEEIVPQLIISSTAKRALKTAELAAQACDFAGELRTTRRFYLADPDEYLEELRTLDEGVQRVMVVGHNPGLEELVTELTGMMEPLSTANVVYVQLPIEQWAELTDEVTGSVRHWWRPKEL